MSAKALSEYSGKELLYRHFSDFQQLDKPQAFALTEKDDFDSIVGNVTWLQNGQKGVIKPDQLIKRRGKHGLVKIGTKDELRKWFDEKKGSYIQVC